jgi:hypothetical protein
MPPRTKERKILNHKIDISILLRAHTHTHTGGSSFTLHAIAVAAAGCVLLSSQSDQKEINKFRFTRLCNEIIEVNGYAGKRRFDLNSSPQFLVVVDRSPLIVHYLTTLFTKIRLLLP